MAYRQFWIGGGAAIVAALALLAWPGEPDSSSDASGNDQVLASFERELNHSPVPARPARGESIDSDVLYRDINSVNWSRRDDVYRAIKNCEERLIAIAADPIDCKFRGATKPEIR